MQPEPYDMVFRNAEGFPVLGDRVLAQLTRPPQRCRMNENEEGKKLS
jgi:hypothetical protein